MSPALFRSPWGLPVAALLLLLAWDFSGLDPVLAGWWANPQGFPWRDHWLLSDVLHHHARQLGWLLLLGLSATWRWPVGVLRQLTPTERAGLIAGVWLSLLAVVLVKGVSSTSCPWDLQVFGGAVPYVSHWDWGQSDGGGGHCFPAGHASTGYAFLAGWVWLRPRHPAAARRWLWTVLLAGTVLGLAQQVRGAHYLSHTLWTAWICWVVPLVLHAVPRLRLHRG
jgi:membrane-associated PAP2 superfamily phosphatase